jgi:hypothetical protein
VAGTFKRRFLVLLGAAVAATACWFVLPGTAIDRAAFTGVARAFANPPFFITGNGRHDSPWNLRTFAAKTLTDPRQAPVMVSLGDDPDGFFQSSPPSPIDLAVVLTNFQRLGAKRAATAAVLAWSAPDPIGLAALDKAIRSFDSLVMAAPLSRGSVPEQMPPAFRKASIPLASIHGDPAALPVVNRIPLPGVILGGDNTRAGFQVLDAEPASKFAPLLARWEDRVVFAFPLLTVLQQRGLTVDGVEVRLGEYLKCGPDGPTVPIDRYGRLAMPLKPLAARAKIPAEAVIDGGDTLLPKDPAGPVVLRDDRSAAEPATRAFSKQLPALIAALASDTSLAPTRDYPRPPARVELTALAALAIILAALCSLPAFPRRAAFLTITGACLTAQCLAAGSASLWLPGLPALAAILTAWLLAKLVPLTPPAALPAPAARPPRQSAQSAVPQQPAAPAATPPATPPPSPPAKTPRQRGKKRRR